MYICPQLRAYICIYARSCGKSGIFIIYIIFVGLYTTIYPPPPRFFSSSTKKIPRAGPCPRDFFASDKKKPRCRGYIVVYSPPKIIYILFSSDYIQRYTRLYLGFFLLGKKYPSGRAFGPRARPCPRDIFCLGRKITSVSGLYRCI